MINRRNLLLGLGSALTATAVPNLSFAQSAPSAARIQRSLEAESTVRIPRNKRIRRKDLRRRRDIRRHAPSIDIQAINFDNGSARIPEDEYWKVENIAQAMRGVSRRRRRGEVYLIEGHTDAVGSRYNNQILSERRARSLKRILVRNFGIDPWSLEAVGFGEDYMLIPTNASEWRNRRVTLRRVTDLIR